MKHVLFAAAESAPFIKTGGLGSVLGSLPKELCNEAMKISVVIPGYDCISQEYHDRMERVKIFVMQLGWRHVYVEVTKLQLGEIDYYFIKNDTYFTGDQPYSDIWVDIEKFAFFDKAVVEMLPHIGTQIDVIHCHDWQTGLIPVFLRTMYPFSSYYKRIKTIITIHNLRFQGICDIQRMKNITGLPDAAFNYDKLEYYGNANMLKGGIAYADIITTVSETYAEEIMTEEFGEGLEALLSYRKEDLRGIVNGIDWDVYDPEQDPNVEVHYNKDNFKDYRKKNKTALQHAVGLPEKDVFTMGIVSRLTEQKGYDLMDGKLDEVLDQGAQLFVLGDGQEEVKDIFLRYQEKYPDQIYIETDYKDAIAKKIYAGCDLTLMPSRFEPCGLNQLMAERYGCLPLVRATGGLKDTVLDDGTLSANGTGFVFSEYNKESFGFCLERAYELYTNDPISWEQRMENGMCKDFSWKASAEKYIDLY